MLVGVSMQIDDIRDLAPRVESLNDQAALVKKFATS